MNMTGRRYIAYGSNLNRAQMALRCPDAKVVGTGEIKDYELLFRGNRNGAVATVEPKKGESVPVLIWRLVREMSLTWTVMRDIRDCMEKKCWKWSWMENGRK